MLSDFSISVFKVGVIDFSMYLKNDIDDYRSEERCILSIAVSFSNMYSINPKPTKFEAVLYFILFPWQQEQPDSIHLGSEELCGGAKPAT